jgi:pectate lyase/pectin methylesterase-like acyl-CoA thioesterase
MKTPALKFLLTLGCALATALFAPAQSTVFNDTFAGGSTVNTNPTSPVSPSLNTAAYQQLSGKTFNPNPPTIAAGHFRQGIVATSSGFNHVQALFTKYPVTLTNLGDYLELTLTFTHESGILTPQTNSTLFFGLYNAGQIQPIPGGRNGTVSTATAGYAQTWQGYVNRLFYTGGSNGFYARPVAGVASTNNQDVLYQGTFSGVGSTTASTLAAFTNGAQYTEVYRITKATATTLTLSSRLYAGATATGTPLYTQSVNSTSILTATFDALAFGFRATGSVASVMDINAITIVTNAATTIVPVITAQPITQTKSVGEPVSLSVTANGGGASPLSYQWKKDTIDIPGANSATYAIPSAALGDTGDYTVVVTNTAGSTTSAIATLTVTSGSVPPDILTDPTGNTLLVGGSHTFTTLVNGTAPLVFQWQKSTDAGANYTDIPGANSASYAITNATLADAGLYRLVVTNGQGSDTSAAAALIVNQGPAITAQPTGATLNLSDPLTLSVTATGTPAPTYQWKLNGANISGATSSTYFVPSVTAANAGNYTVTVTNAVSSVTSATASVVVLSPTMAVTSVTPVNAGTNLLSDTRLTITFNTAVSPGISGLIRIYDASNDTVVDTIDLVAATTLRNSLRAVSTLSTLNLPVQNKSIGGTTNFNYYPITVSGNTATIYPRNGVLAYAKSYYVKIDAGAFIDSSGLAFSGIDNATTWAFSTKSSGPTSTATSLTVAADGSGDFYTLQAAIDLIPTGNTTPRTITVKNGTYFEEIVMTNRGFIKILGQDRALTRVVYPNNNTFNNVGGGIYHRATFIASGVSNLTLANLTFHNTTPQNGSQAEALIISGSTTTGKNVVSNVSLYSYQDTLQTSGQCYITDSYIEGDVDFLWGGGPTFFNNCEIKILRTGAYFAQVRNGSGNHGFVFRNCRFTAAAGIANTFFNRIDPAGFPYSEVVILDSTFGDATNNAFLSTVTGNSGTDYKATWWLLNGTSAATLASLTPNLHNWTNNIVDRNGVALTDGNSDTFTEMPADATTQANYRNAFWVLNHRPSDNTTPGSWTPVIAPIFLSQPADATVDSGQPVTFTAVTAALPAATYQWKKDGTDIPGATSASYTIPNAIGLDGGSYTVVATNASGSTTSAAAILTVISLEPPPVIITPPASQSVNLGAPATFTVTATGNDLRYQWYKGGLAISGATSASFTINTVTLADAGSYSVIVTNDTAHAPSSAAALTTIDPYAAFLATVGIGNSSLAPSDGDNDGDGSSNLLEFILNGNPALAGQIPAPHIAIIPSDGTYTLLFDFVRRKDAAFVQTSVQHTSDFVTWTTAIPGQNGVVVTVTSLDATTENVAYQIPSVGPRVFARLLASTNLEPVLVSQPAGQSLLLGGSATLTVSATGVGPITYQWYKNGSAILGSTSASLTLNNVTASDAGNYTVMATNWAGSALSTVAMINVASTLPPARTFALEGFASTGAGVTGGGAVDFANPGANYVVIDSSTANPAQTLKTYLESTTAYVIELRTDVDLAPLNNVGNKPKFSAWLGVTSMGIVKPKSNKTLFSVSGATIRHGIIEISGQSNIMIRNLEFRGLWEWDDESAGGYKIQDWDYVRIQDDAFNVWVDHCDFEKSYDGLLDIKQGASQITVSWCRLSGDNEGVAQSMINHLESLYQANPANPAIAHYASKRATQSPTQILALEIPQDKCNLLGAGDPATMSEPGYSTDPQTLEDAGRLNITFHHLWYRGIRQRQPRLRYGNGHIYNNYLDETSLVGTGVGSTGLAVTTNAVMLGENVYFNEVTAPLSVNTTTFPARAMAQTGGVWIKNGIDISATLNTQTGVTSAASLVWNAPRPGDALAATWTNLSALPYSYTLDPVTFIKDNPSYTGAIVPNNDTDRATLRTLLVTTAP